MKRAVNPARVAEGGVALLLGLMLLWLALTRTYQYYVTPRTLPYLYFASAALLVTAGLNFARIFELTHVRRYTHLLSLLIPLMLMTASIKVENLWGSPLFPQSNDTLESSTLLEQTYEMKAEGYAGRVLHGYDTQRKTLTIPEDETYFWLTEIYTDPTPFLGFTVTTMGQVLKDAKFFPEGNCFSPVRKLMTCCVTDLFTVGIKCQYEQTQALTEDAWVTVTGTLAMADLEETRELRLMVTQVKACAPPAEPYVYAY